MSLDEKFIPVQNAFYNIVQGFFQKIAGLFGYPENPGMLIIDRHEDARRSHQTFWPPLQFPETWFEMIFGPSPKVDSVPKYTYDIKEYGFYSFFIEDYTNIYFLPDWLSEFVQVRLNFCLNITFLETIREILFLGLMVYSQIVILRIALSWFIYINPYKSPWRYLVATVDWTDDILQGTAPSILGVNITATLFLGILGVIGDSLNHLVFTMPFLPSEGEKTNLIINEETKAVVLFRYLPVLWYRYPIPNNIREFWYKERRDILDYMQKTYKDLDIHFIPNRIIEENLFYRRILEEQNRLYPPRVRFNEIVTADLSQLHDSLIAKSSSITDYISTEILSKGNLIHLPSINLINEHFHNF